MAVSVSSMAVSGSPVSNWWQYIIFRINFLKKFWLIRLKVEVVEMIEMIISLCIVNLNKNEDPPTLQARQMAKGKELKWVKTLIVSDFI